MSVDPIRAKSVFLAASELDTAERAAYLDQECGDDADLRSRIGALLAAHDAAGPMPNSAAAAPSAHEPHKDETLLAGDGIGPAPVNGNGAGSDDHVSHVPLTFLSPAQRPDSLGRIGHYEILKILGQGAFGIVFRAFDDILQRVVAVKVLYPHMAATSPARKRFLREARASAAVRHENVVQVYEVGDEPLPYIAMEFVPGETLQQRLDRTGPLDVRNLLQIGRQIAEGLAAAHAIDLIHRDIKPGNILIEGAQQRVKITDFGLARAADDASVTQSGVLAGTPMYMAPEQASGQTLDHRTDLFSLGSVLYQMASGRPPFRANGTIAVLKRVASDTPRPIREIIPETPPWVCEIIERLHAKDPKDRFQSARELADVLAAYEAHIAANTKISDLPHLPLGKRAAARRGRGRWLLATAVIALPLLLLATTEIAGVTHWLHRGRSMAANSATGATQLTKVGSTTAPSAAQASPDVASPLPNKDSWNVLKPVEMKSEGGATLALQTDGSILASGTHSTQDTYTLTFSALPAEIRALRLEVLPHESLPQGGPGRDKDTGEFALTGIKCRVTSSRTGGGERLIEVAKASADNRRGLDSLVGFAIDGDDQTAWVTEAGKAHYAIFDFAEPIVGADGATLRVSLEFKHPDGRLALGCFRLSAAKQAIGGE